MANRNKRNRYINKKKQEEKKPAVKNFGYLIGIIAVILVLGVFFAFSTTGKNFFSSLLSKENDNSQAVQLSTGSKNDSSGQPDNSDSTNDEPVAASEEKDESVVITEKKSDENMETKKENYITISLSDISRQGNYFSYTSRRNVKINYFGILDKDGKPHIAIDACDVCFRARKGYALQGDQAICRNCGNRYPITAIGTENIYGGCWPSYLPMEVVGNEIRIPTEELEAKEYMFS